jgi:hypothetical protein
MENVRSRIVEWRKKRMMMMMMMIIIIIIYFNCKWVFTRWQLQYSKIQHTNNSA